jgi:hypothetical protein
VRGASGGSDADSELIWQNCSILRESKSSATHVPKRPRHPRRQARYFLAKWQIACNWFVDDVIAASPLTSVDDHTCLAQLISPIPAEMARISPSA